MAEILKVTDRNKLTTDPVLLSALVRQGIDKDYVEFVQDYAPAYVNGKKVKGQSPYAKFYRDLRSNKRFMVVSGLPMVDADGNKIESGWRVAGINYFAPKNNLFYAKVQGTQVEITIRNDQPDGRKAGDKLTFKPQLFLDGIEHSPSMPLLLPVDPVNSNYLENTLEWDYGICKRRLRVIEGRLLGSWVFAQKPTGEVRIKYNQTGDYKLKLGQFRVNDDEEIIPKEAFDNIERYFLQSSYPLTVGDSLTFYPDAHVETNSVDGMVYRGFATNESWATVHDSAGTDAVDDGLTNITNLIFSGAAANQWYRIYRSPMLFYTEAIPDTANITAATLSIYYYTKGDDAAIAPSINIYSSNPASNTALVPADYNLAKWGDTAFSTPIAYADWGGTYNDFVLNASGIAAISKTGVSKFGTRSANYDAPNSAPVWTVGEVYSQCGGYSSEQGNGFKPKLVVTYTTIGWANIAKVNGVAAAAIAKMNGVAVASIAKINGVAV